MLTPFYSCVTPSGAGPGVTAGHRSACAQSAAGGPVLIGEEAGT